MQLLNHPSMQFNKLWRYSRTCAKYRGSENLYCSLIWWKNARKCCVWLVIITGQSIHKRGRPSRSWNVLAAADRKSHFCAFLTYGHNVPTAWPMLNIICMHAACIQIKFWGSKVKVTMYQRKVEILLIYGRDHYIIFGGTYIEKKIRFSILCKKKKLLP